MVETDFKYDVFLSHSSQNKDVVQDLANRLKSDGVRVWLDEWEIRPGDSIPAKVEDGLENSRVLVLCMSAEAFGSDWTQLESHTFRFKDPLNQNRRFIPLRLDDTPTKGSLAQFSYIDWRTSESEREYTKLLNACKTVEELPETQIADGSDDTRIAVQLALEGHSIWAMEFSPDRNFAFTSEGLNSKTAQLWDLKSGQCLRTFKGHTREVECFAWSFDQNFVLTSSGDHTIRLWDVATGSCIRVFKGHDVKVRSVALFDDQTRIISGSEDRSLRMWDLKTGNCLRVFIGNSHQVSRVALSPDQRHAVSGGWYGEIRLWDINTGQLLHVLEGHSGTVWSITFNTDQSRILSGGEDNTLRLWDFESGKCLRALEGHTGSIFSVRWGDDPRLALSGSTDKTIRLWNVETGQCLRVFEGHTNSVVCVAWDVSGRHAISSDKSGVIRMWDLSEFVTDVQAPSTISPPTPPQFQYTNAKVLLIGNSAAGKTGLSNRLALNNYKETDSTVGAWATQWKLPLPEGDDVAGDSHRSDEDGLGPDAIATNVEREVWLWDFGGQADQRLIHQLYMDQTQVAALVFDPQKQDLLESLATWERDLQRASTSDDFKKLLVAGRIDAGKLRPVSKKQIERFAEDHGYAKYIETSAKENTGCDELKEWICKLIDWDSIAKRSSPLLFRRLKEEIVRLKDEGRILMRFNELREALSLRLSGDDKRFTDAELKTVITLLAGPGVVWELAFGSWILLAPELVNSYAQAVIRTLQEDERELGCIVERRVLDGDLNYPKDLKRLPEEEERIILLAMQRMLAENGICLREQTETGALLVFPSYARRERPEKIEHPSVLVSYQFEGFLDDVYATLVVRLHHTSPFTLKALWNGAADFQTIGSRDLGLKLERKSAGAAELLVYFDPATGLGEMMTFSKYVHEHLLKKATDRASVTRLRHWVCECGEPVENRAAAMRRLNSKGREASIICVECEKRVKLWDPMEEAFAAPSIIARIRELDEEAEFELDSESKERTLVGEVISTVSLAGQICRETPIADWGIDAEVEFKNDDQQATGKKVYLQLKSGDSHRNIRKKDKVEIFKGFTWRQAQYWMEQAFPVMLVIRNSKGEVHWMEIRDHLKDVTNNGKKQVRQIEFEGQRFDVMSVRRWRANALGLDQV